MEILVPSLAGWNRIYKFMLSYVLGQATHPDRENEQTANGKWRCRGGKCQAAGRLYLFHQPDRLGMNELKT